MKPLPPFLPQMIRPFRSAPRLAHPHCSPVLFCDFDGTLVPIRRNPAKVALSSRARTTLQSLARRIPVVIISGRSLSYLQKTIAIPNVGFAGNHGLEMKVATKRFCHPRAVLCQKKINRLARHLKNDFKGVSGVLIEEKGLTLTFHYRLVRPKDREAVCEAFYDSFKQFTEAAFLKVRPGKMSLEVRPDINWGKEQAMLWILNLYQKEYPKDALYPIYIGDDETDKAALALAQKRGVSIFKGGQTRSVKATYFIVSLDQLIRFLKQLASK